MDISEARFDELGNDDRREKHINFHIYPSVHNTKAADRLGIAHTPKAAACFAIACGTGTIVTPARDKKHCLAFINCETLTDTDRITDLIEHRLQLRQDSIKHN